MPSLLSCQGEQYLVVSNQKKPKVFWRRCLDTTQKVQFNVHYNWEHISTMPLHSETPERFSGRRVQAVFTVVLLAGAIGLGWLALRNQARAAAQVREERWQQDLRFFVTQLSTVQLNFDKLFPSAKFRQDIGDLERDVPQLSDSEVVLRLMRLVAAAGVSHTTVRWPGGKLAFHEYPLEAFWYADGLAVTGAAEQYSVALGARIIKIASMTPEELEAAVAPYIAHENLPWLHQLSPEFMLTQEVAAHFGLASPDGSVEITLERPGAEPFKLSVAPLASSASPHMVTALEALHLPKPLYRKGPSSYYWYEFLPEKEALYIQYSRCADDSKKSFKDFAEELFQLVDKKQDAGAIKRVVVDLRFNQGGNSEVVRPLLEGLKARPGLRAKGHLYVLIGRSTFSSGMMAAFDFRDQLHAILVGEPIGGKPNEYGEVKVFRLPNSNIEVQYTTKYFQLFKDSDPSTLEPDVTVVRAIADFLNGGDPVLDAALNR